MSDKLFKLNEKGSFILEDGEPLKPLGNVVHKLNEQQDTIGEQKIAIDELITDYKKLEKENEHLRNELTFLNKVISFFADTPMTKYSSKSELLEDMELLEKMRLI